MIEILTLNADKFYLISLIFQLTIMLNLQAVNAFDGLHTHEKNACT